VSNETCVFEPIIDGTAVAHRVLDEADLVAFLDIRPVFPGHTLVVPRHHYATIADLPAGMAARLWDAGARVAAAQRISLGAEGTFFGLNDVISQSVPHVHLHVVPRRRKDGLRGFFWPRQKYEPGQAEAVSSAIRDALGPPAPVAAELPPVRVRTAGPEDAGAVALLLAGGSIRAGEDPSDPEPYRAVIASEGNVLVAESEGRVVGVCQLMILRHLQQQGGRCAEIESMHVAESHRGKGIGSVLLEEAVERAREAGCYRVQLTSNKVRTAAHRFYARHGFVASHEGFKLYL
jgi:histidine triad (HIT) family protein